MLYAQKWEQQERVREGENEIIWASQSVTSQFSFTFLSAFHNAPVVNKLSTFQGLPL
jgi:hypothetical protein